MGSESDCKMEEEDPSANISGQNPKFFKIILQDTIREGRLAIPKKFVLIYGYYLSNRVILKVPADGTKWEMELSKSGNRDEAWLEKGWKEFSEHYSLEYAYMLVFEYRDASSFHVFVFDTTLTEIEYPREPNAIPNLEQNPSQLNEFAEIEDSDCKNLEIEEKCNESEGRTVPQSLEAAEKFSSTKPWFKLVLKANKWTRQSLNVPRGFVKEHTVGHTHTMNLMVEGSKRCWPIKLRVVWNCASLAIGWRAFFDDNCLKDKDVIVFELIATETLKVKKVWAKFLTVSVESFGVSSYNWPS